MSTGYFLVGDDIDTDRFQKKADVNNLMWLRHDPAELTKYISDLPID